MNSSMENHDPFQSCEFKENLDVLRETYLFSKLPMEPLKVFAYLCTKETHRAGDFLFRQGDEDDQARILLSGTARLIHQGQDGGETALREYGPGDFIGAMSLLGKITRLYSLRAETDTTCLALDRERFGRTLRQFPGIAPVVVQALAEQIHAWEEKLLTHDVENCRRCGAIVGISLI